MSVFFDLGVRLVSLASLAAIGAVVYSYVRMLWLRTRLPPGPFPLPIIGNMHLLNASKPWLQFDKWSQENNEGLLTIWIGRTPIVICNDAWSASDLMEKRSHLYSSRPRYVIFGDITGQQDCNQVFMPHNDHWRLQRKVMHTAVGSQALKPYKSFQEDEGKVLMSELLDSPNDFALYFERYACSLVSILGYGRRIESKDDYMLRFAVSMMDGITMMQVPGLYWLEAIPELQYLPSWIYALPNRLRKRSQAVAKYWWGLVSEGAQARESNFAKTLVKSKEEQGLTELDIAEMIANTIGGGLDTTSSTLHTMVLGLCVFPGAQRKAHEELDRVVGRDRSPTWDDLDKLPYCAAVLKEAMRWRSVTAMGGFAHTPEKDDVYRGYHFHAGIHIFGNLWGIHRNPKDFLEPDVFDPDRYLDENRRPYPNPRGHNAFGWGRRSCSGQLFAEQGLAMTVARMLWCYRFEPGLDLQGNPVKLDIWNYTDNENTQPRLFPARFIPRTETIREIIVQQAKEAKGKLQVYESAARTKFEA
ncbi:hypothetical protein LTR10_021969 [Elasticomyces elasticus]|nr:hypothetical protein LTR10_021969 [Elasticomyces elasticus]